MCRCVTRQEQSQLIEFHTKFMSELGLNLIDSMYNFNCHFDYYDKNHKKKIVCSLALNSKIIFDNLFHYYTYVSEYDSIPL